MSEDEIKALSQDDSYICLCGRLIDKFADNGIVAITIGQIEGKVLHIRLWLMSCRVLKREMEYVMMNQLVSLCKERQIEIIKGYYIPTNKNSMVANFYEQFGFMCIKNDADGSAWEIKSMNYTDMHLHMLVEVQ